MSISAKRKLAVGAAGLAVLAGSGGAYAAAAGQPGPPAKPADLATEQKAFLDDVAKRLNVPRDQLDSAIKGAAEARIDAAVAAGRLTTKQGEAAKKRLAAGVPLLGGPGMMGGNPGRPGFGGPGFRGRGMQMRGFDGAAEYLGLAEAQLRDELRDGKSLADIAEERDKDVAGLKAVLKAGLTEKLDEAVKDGHLSEARKNAILEDVDERLDDLIERARPAGPKFRWR